MKLWLGVLSLVVAGVIAVVSGLNAESGGGPPAEPVAPGAVDGPVAEASLPPDRTPTTVAATPIASPQPASAAAPAEPDPLEAIFGCTQEPGGGGCSDPPTLLVAGGALPDAPLPGGGSEAAAPQPDGGSVTLDVGFSHPKVLAGGYRTVWLSIGIGAENARPAKRLPLNLALVIDRSGSMEGRKLRDVRKAAHGLADLLAADDRVSIVSYSNYARADVPSTLVDDAARTTLGRAIDRMRASGNTFLSAGLYEGHAQVQQHARRNQVNRVLLLSDGIANRGITDPGQLARMARTNSQNGVLVSTIGVGNDYNEDLMTSLADYGGGAYYYVRDSQDLAQVVEREARMMASTVAQRMTLEIDLPQGVVLDNLFGYTSTKEGNTVVVPLAEAFAGQARDVLVQLRVPAIEQGPLPVARVRLSYEDVTGEEPERFDRAVAVETVVTRDTWAVEDAVDRRVLARLQEIRIAEALNEAARAIDAGDRGRANRVLNTARLEAVQANKGYANEKLDNSIGVLGGVMDEMSAAPAAAAAGRALMKRAKASSYEISK